MAGGGAWKVAYADFVTAMMALFMVLWISAQDKEILIATSQYFQNPFRSPIDASSGVMPFNSNRSRDSSSRGAGTHGGGSHSPLAGANAQVEVVKEGDKVVRLIVTCTCGERVEIECLYTAGR